MNKIILILLHLCWTIHAWSQVQLKEIGQLDDLISEPSGIEVIYNTSNGHMEYWMHNDYNNPSSLFSVQPDNISGIQRIIDTGIPFVDWEDMSLDDSGNIYLGDFGNWVQADELQVVKIPNPNNYNNAPPSVEIIEYTYPFNGISDMEGMVHHGDSIYLFTKRVNPINNPSLDIDKTYCFRIPDVPHPVAGQKYTADLVGSFAVVLPDDVDSTRFRVTGADISPDGRTLALLCYERIWVFSCFKGSDFFNGTVSKLEIPFRQYEGITFINNHEVVISKEGKADNPGFNPKLYYVDLHPWIDGSCVNCEKLINGDFSQANLAWTKFIGGNNNADATFTITNGQAEMDIHTLGTSQWNINLRHKGLILENGKAYRIRYKAYAEDDRPVSVIVNNRSGSLGYFWHSDDITTTPTYYSHDFTMNEADDFNAYFSLNVGKHIAHKVYFDDVSITETGCNCPPNRSFIADISHVTQRYEVSDTIHGQNQILGDTIIYDAGQAIHLNSNFKVSKGALFEAVIDGCDN